jgi:hypothetical protein
LTGSPASIAGAGAVHASPLQIADRQGLDLPGYLRRAVIPKAVDQVVLGQNLGQDIVGTEKQGEADTSCIPVNAEQAHRHSVLAYLLVLAQVLHVPDLGLRDAHP